MSKILVTGGAGYIGSHTVVELHNAGYIPIIIDNFCNSEKSAITGTERIIGTNVKLYEGDCNDSRFMESVFESEENISGCIHFAAYKAVGESVSNPLKYYGNNVHSLVVLLDTMRKYKVANIVFSSSCTVYGQPDALPVTEESPVKPAKSPYGNTKQICEAILKDIMESGENIKTISLRYFNPIGAHPSSNIGELPIGIPNNLIPFLTQSAIGIRGELVVFGDDYDTVDGSCIRDYIHVVDLAKAHVKALLVLENIQETNYLDFINLGTGNGNSVLEVINTFESNTGIKVNYRIGPRREGDVVKVWADVKKAKDTLDWAAEFSLSDSLADAWNWQLRLKNQNEK